MTETGKDQRTSLTKSAVLLTTVFAVGGATGLGAYEVSKGNINIPDLFNKTGSESASVENTGQIKGMIAVDTALKEDFLQKQKKSVTGLNEADISGLKITVKGKDFNFITFLSDNGVKENWWMQNGSDNGDWQQLEEKEMSGISPDGQEINVNVWKLGNENVLWYPENSFEWKREGNIHISGLVFRPPTVTDAKEIAGYDANKRLGILIPIDQETNPDPYSAEVIFEGIAYRTDYSLNRTPTAEPIDKSQQIMERASQNFLYELAGTSLTENQTIFSLRSRLSAAQDEGKIKILMSNPTFDSQGNLENQNLHPMVCGYENSGQFILVINTNAYANPGAVEGYSTASQLDECLEMQVILQEKIDKFKSSNPNSNVQDILKNNPLWVKEAADRAWFRATRDVLDYLRNDVPNNSVYKTLLNIFDQSKGDEETWLKLIQNSKGLPSLGTL